MGIELDKAFELAKKDPLPDDIIEQLDELYENADFEDREKMSFLYEAVSLILSEKTAEQIRQEE
tara:strand:+ start:336 stop:527 length:192 start_codon:yes stop_codon:yes gene_type:complete